MFLHGLFYSFKDHTHGGLPNSSRYANPGHVILRESFGNAEGLLLD
jgi:hypothetical protein